MIIACPIHTLDITKLPLEIRFVVVFVMQHIMSALAHENIALLSGHQCRKRKDPTESLTSSLIKSPSVSIDARPDLLAILKKKICCSKMAPYNLFERWIPNDLLLSFFKRYLSIGELFVMSFVCTSFSKTAEKALVYLYDMLLPDTCRNPIDAWIINLCYDRAEWGLKMKIVAPTNPQMLLRMVIKIDRIKLLKPLAKYVLVQSDTFSRLCRSLVLHATTHNAHKFISWFLATYSPNTQDLYKPCIRAARFRHIQCFIVLLNYIYGNEGSRYISDCMNMTVEWLNIEEFGILYQLHPLSYNDQIHATIIQMDLNEKYMYILSHGYHLPTSDLYMAIVYRSYKIISTIMAYMFCGTHTLRCMLTPRVAHAAVATNIDSTTLRKILVDLACPYDRKELLSTAINMGNAETLDFILNLRVCSIEEDWSKEIYATAASRGDCAFHAFAFAMANGCDCGTEQWRLEQLAGKRCDCMEAAYNVDACLEKIRKGRRASITTPSGILYVPAPVSE
jgi:hypothetical protein